MRLEPTLFLKCLCKIIILEFLVFLLCPAVQLCRLGPTSFQKYFSSFRGWSLKIYLLFLLISPYYTDNKETSLEELSLAEFSGELVRQRFYENDYKDVLRIWFDLVWKVKYNTILIFKVIFLCQKSARSLWILYSLENTKMGEQFLLLTYFDNFDCTYFIS